MAHARLLDRVLRRNAAFVFAHSRLIIIFYLLLIAASGWYAWYNLGVKTSSQDLIGREHHVLQRAQRFADEFRKEEDFVVLIESDSAEESAEAIEWVAERISAEPRLMREDGTNLFYKIDQRSMQERALLYLSDEQLRELQARLAQAAAVLGEGEPFTLSRMLERVGESLRPETLASGETDSAFAQLGFVTSMLRQVKSALEGGASRPGGALLFGEALSSPAESPYLSYHGGRSLILLLNPKGGTESFTPHAETIPLLRKILESARAQFPGVTLGLTGEPVLSNDEQDTYQRDTTIALLVTIAVVFLSFAYAYRQVTRPLLKIGVLLASLVLALAFTAATVGHLNMLSVAFVVMIMGLGDDFAIYMITRYEEERSRGAAPEQALGASMVQAGNSVVMASLTTSTAFGSMIFTGFLGLVEMGIIAGSGLLICAFLCLTLLPALLLQQRTESAGERHEIQHRITPLLLSGERRLARHTPIVLVVLACVVLGCLAAVVQWQSIPAVIADLRAGAGVQKAAGRIFNVGFQYDLLDLQNAGLESVKTARKLTQLQPIYVAAVTTESLDKVSTLQQRLAALPTVAKAVSILGSSDRGESLPTDQEAKLPLVQSIQQQAAAMQISPTPEVDLPSFTSAVQSLEQGARALAQLIPDAAAGAPLVQLGEAAAAVAARLASLTSEEAGARLATHQQQLGTSLAESIGFLAQQRADQPMTIEHLPEAYRARYIGQTGKLLIEVFPSEDLSVKANLERFNEEVLAVAPLATGTPIDLNIFVDLLRLSYVKAALYAFGFIALLVVLYFRGVVATLLCLIPLLVGIFILAALMPPLGLAFNLANIITLPLILGIGVDNGILILERFRSAEKVELFAGNTGRAILMSNLTTIAGFIALGMAQHQGIASLGRIMALGVSAAMLASLIFMPAMLRLLKRRGIPI